MAKAIINKRYKTKGKETTGKKAGILIVDDHPIVRQGLSQLIRREEDLFIFAEAEDGESALETLKTGQPDMAIVDISLKGLSGIDLIKQMQATVPQMPILVLSMHDEDDYVESAFMAGARGYITKQEAAEQIIEAVSQVLGGDIYLSDDLAKKMVNKLITKEMVTDNSPPQILTSRELEVFRLLGLGSSTVMIASELGLSIKTVETYRAKIKKKLKLKNSIELIQQAYYWNQRT